MAAFDLAPIGLIYFSGFLLIFSPNSAEFHCNIFTAQFD